MQAIDPSRSFSVHSAAVTATATAPGAEMTGLDEEAASVPLTATFSSKNSAPLLWILLLISPTPLPLPSPSLAAAAAAAVTDRATLLDDDDGRVILWSRSHRSASMAAFAPSAAAVTACLYLINDVNRVSKNNTVSH